MRVVAIADSDSYAKWAAALLSRMPANWQCELIIVRTAKEPSPSQLSSALSGTRLDESGVRFFELDDAIARVAAAAPDVVLVASIGPLVDLLCERILLACERRPVLVSGVPGIALPARRKALAYRSQIDLMIVHSRTELRRFAAIARINGFSHEFALATLPYLSASSSERRRPNDDIIFAAQAIVPPTRQQRAMLLGWLHSFALAHPNRRVVIKVRATDGEGQTHDEADSYLALLELLDTVPSNLVVETGPMSAHLQAARALVTVSSTAAIEAISLGVPVIVINDFGVSPELINDVFVGSGLLASSGDLLNESFRHANPEWLNDNYFHAETENDWQAALESLVVRNVCGELPPRERLVRGAGGSLRRAWDKKRALGRYDRSLGGLVALGIGLPARTLVLALGELLRLASDERPQPQPLALKHEAPAEREAGRATRRP